VARMVIRVLSADASFQLRIVSIGSGKLIKIWQYLKLLFFAVLGFRPMFMHAYLYQACPARSWLLRQTGVIIWCHGVEVWGSYGRLRVPEIGDGPMLWAVSQFTAQRIKDNWASADVRVVPLAVLGHNGKGKQGLRVRSDVGLRLLTVSRFAADERYKGHDLSLHALARLRAEGVPFCFDIVGDGNDRMRLMNLAAQLGIDDNIVFHGAIAQSSLENLYEISDVFLMPSQVKVSDTGIWGGEGFGLVYIEAAMYGIPSIAGESGGHTDFIEHDVTGWRVADDVNALADLLKYLYHNNQVIMECGLRCFCKASSQYSLASFTQRLGEALSMNPKHDSRKVSRFQR
jgi:phosphatidylinositol alpha-1,6-mannosyltransferase